MPSSIDHSQFSAVAALIAARRSIRRYRPEPVPRAWLDELLQCAINAPSAHNRQPWRFIALHDGRSKTRLAEAMGARLRADRLKDGDPISAVEADVARSIDRISRAPVVLLVAATTAEMDAYGDTRRQNAEYLMSVQSTAMATQNLLLAVHAAGLAACWMCAPLFCPDTVRNVLELPMDWQPQSIITIGFPASAGKPYTRKPLEEVLRHVGAP